MNNNTDLNNQQKPSHEALNNAQYKTFILDRPFVLTHNKCLSIGMPYLYSEGRYIAAVRITDIYESERIIYLQLEELDSMRKFTVDWNLDYKGGYHIWSIADLNTIMNL